MEETTTRRRARIPVMQLWHQPWFLIPTLVWLNIGFALNLLFSHGEEILWLNTWRTTPLRFFFQAATYLGEAIAFIVVGFYLMRLRYRYALVVALIGMSVGPVTYSVKRSFSVPRPATFFAKTGRPEAMVAVPSVKPITGHTSFPSGHTAAAFALFSTATLGLTETSPHRKRWGLVFALAAILTACSRVFLAQHFLPDVLAGTFFGLLVGGVWWHFARWLESHIPWLGRHI